MTEQPRTRRRVAGTHEPTTPCQPRIREVSRIAERHITKESCVGAAGTPSGQDYVGQHRANDRRPRFISESERVFESYGVRVRVPLRNLRDQVKMARTPKQTQQLQVPPNLCCSGRCVPAHTGSASSSRPLLTAILEACQRQTCLETPVPLHIFQIPTETPTVQTGQDTHAIRQHATAVDPVVRPPSSHACFAFSHRLIRSHTHYSCI